MFSPEIKKGSVALLLLSLLEGRDRHGYEIGKLIEARSGGRLEEVRTGPPLHLQMEALRAE